jgi:hypothetical protein
MPEPIIAGLSTGLLAGMAAVTALAVVSPGLFSSIGGLVIAGAVAGAAGIIAGAGAYLYLCAKH